MVYLYHHFSKSANIRVCFNLLTPSTSVWRAQSKINARARERDAIYRNLHACAKRGTSLTHTHAVGTRWVVMRQFDRFVGPDCPVPFIIPPLHHRPRKVFGWFSHGCHRCSTISTYFNRNCTWEALTDLAGGLKSGCVFIQRMIDGRMTHNPVQSCPIFFINHSETILLWG